MKQILSFVFWVAISCRLFSQDMEQRLDSIFKVYYTPGQPAATVCIRLHGKVIFERGYGFANVTTQVPIDRGTRFNIGSITKQFTAYCILLLESQKHLSLADKLSKYFPIADPIIGGITIRQLLTHSSGLEDHYAFTDTGTIKHATDKDVLDAVMKQHGTLFTPGSQYRYSNTAYCLLGMIIEKLSGMSYASYLRKNIFDPLSMASSSVFKNGVPIPHRAMGYTAINGRAGFQLLDADQAIFFSTEADGGIYITMSDYIRWFDALQLRTRLDAALIDKARSPQFPIDAARKLAYGFGWFILGSDAAKSVYHTGSNGGFRAIVFTQPAKDNAVVILSNRDDIDLEMLLEQVNQILHIDSKSFTKIDSLVSFINSWPNFAPCKKTPLYSISSGRNSNASATALN